MLFNYIFGIQSKSLLNIGMLEILILSLVQGVTEFLPISSSSHIILFSKFMNFISEDLILNVSLHIGSFLAVLVFFRKEILSFFIYRKVFMLIIIASLPIILCGYLIAQSGIINDLRSLKIIGWTTVLFGILLYFSDKMENEKNLEINLDIKSALIIGFLHIFSLIPGVSRSGIAITAARFLIGAIIMGTLLFSSKKLKKEDFKKPWRFFVLGLTIVIYFVLMLSLIHI